MEVGRRGLTRDVGVARGIDRDGVALLAAVAAEVSRVDEFVPRGAQLRDERLRVWVAAADERVNPGVDLRGGADGEREHGRPAHAAVHLRPVGAVVRRLEDAAPRRPRVEGRGRVGVVGERHHGEVGEPVVDGRPVRRAVRGLEDAAARGDVERGGTGRVHDEGADAAAGQPRVRLRPVRAAVGRLEDAAGAAGRGVDHRRIRRVDDEVEDAPEVDARVRLRPGRAAVGRFHDLEAGARVDDRSVGGVNRQAGDARIDPRPRRRPGGPAVNALDDGGRVEGVPARVEHRRVGRRDGERRGEGAARVVEARVEQVPFGARVGRPVEPVEGQRVERRGRRGVGPHPRDGAVLEALVARLPRRAAVGALDEAVVGADGVDRRVVGGACDARDVGAAGPVQRDAEPRVVREAAEVCGVDERRARRVELGDEDVGRDAAHRDELHAGGGEGERARGARDVGVVRRVEREGRPAGETEVVDYADEGRIREDRVDDERAARVVSPDAELDLRPLDFVPALDLPARAVVRRLVDDGALHTHLSAADREDEAPVLLIQLRALRAVELNLDAARVCSRCDVEIVFELSLVAVIDEVDARVDAGVMHLAIHGDARAPVGRVVADEVVQTARHLFAPLDLRLGARARQTHPQDAVALLPLTVRTLLPAAATQRQHGLVRREEHDVAVAAREEPHARVGLPAVGLELERQFAVSLGRRLGTRGARVRCGRRFGSVVGPGRRSRREQGYAGREQREQQQQQRGRKFTTGRSVSA